jgi:mannan endo-1,4-beta-mannosidase
VTVRGITGLLAAAAVAASLTACLPSPSPGTGSAGQPGAGSSAPASKPLLPPYDTTRLVTPPSGKYFGVEVSGNSASLAPVAQFAASVGKKPNIIGQYLGWNVPFDPQAVLHHWSYGALTYLSWEPFHTSLRAIAAGRSDAYITVFARAVRTLNLPVAISFGHEMNGNWYPWGTEQTTPAEFVAAWRHIHNVFTRAGATNVIWVWNPNNVFPVPQVKLKPYYPGDAYVDWAGITGYFATDGPQTFATLYRPTIDEIRHFTSKPILIAETSVQTGPAEVACVSHLLSSVTRHHDVLGFIWFDYSKGGVDWRVESRPILREAMTKGLTGLPLVPVG